MNARLVRRTCACLLMAGFLVVTVGCREDGSSAETKATPENRTTVQIDPASLDQVQAILAKADAYDGTTNKHVSKCAACALGMDGNTEHAMKVAGYKMLFCTEGCRESFTADAAKSILALNVPEG